MPRRKPNYQRRRLDRAAADSSRRLGLVARCKSPTIIGYFFGPRFAEPPTMADTVGLRREDSLIGADVGDLGLRTGEWHVVGHQPS